MDPQPTRRNFVKTIAAGWASSALAPLVGAAGVAAVGPRIARQPQTKPGVLFPFYVMDTGLVGPDVPALADKVKLVKELGFIGVDFQLNHDALPEMLAQLDQHGLELSATYLTPKLEEAPDPRLAESLSWLKGRPTRIELCVQSKQFQPSDPQGDERGLRLVKHVSDLAADTGPVVSIYPHRGCWTERVEDGLRLVRAAQRQNVGTNFNLVHWKWLPQEKPLKTLLADALPHLFTVTINGLKGDAIVPLDEGDYDLAGFLLTLKKIGYKGRIGLQSYSVPGPSRAHLARSMARWREMMKKLAPDT